MSVRKLLLIVLSALQFALPSFAQDKGDTVDSLVSLLSAKSVELIEKQGQDYRKVTGPARFLHNNTFLVCDTALWNVNADEIEAIGNVQIIQEGTVLTSDMLTYLVAQDLAQFRGHVVQLEDKDRNTLRTRHLDYNTKDSVAVFMNGGAMKDKDGQIIESLNGTYDSKVKTFTFAGNVNMFTDSIFVKTNRLEYRSEQNMAIFGTGTNAWKDDGMLSSEAGWYDRGRELFLFYRNVHGMTNEQEGWADSLYFNRASENVEMLGHAQVTDTTRNVSALGGRIFYEDSLSRITMTRTPAIVGVTDTTRTAKDTVYVGADTLVFRSLMKFQIDTTEFSRAAQRKSDISADAIGAYRKSAYEAAVQAAKEAQAQDEDYIAEQEAKAKRESLASAAAKADSLASLPATSLTVQSTDSVAVHATDSLAVHASDSLTVNSQDSLATVLSDSISVQVSDSLLSRKDSLSTQAVDSLVVGTDSLALSSADSLSAIPAAMDSTKVAFIYGRGDVKLYREDFQMLSDTLKFNELDSLIRLYKDPIVWNDGNRQYSADSIYVSFGEKSLDRAYLMSNAFVTVEEAPDCYDQIRSTEMLAYFDDKGALSRFDATGGVDAIFYIKEDSTLATVNKSQAKLLLATLKDGDLDDIYYFDAVKNDAYPLAQMKASDRQLKGFNWNPDQRPIGPQDVTPYKLRPGQRLSYASRPRAAFIQTDIYFPGYIEGIHEEIDERKERKDSIAAANALAQRDRTAASDSLLSMGEKLDSLSMAADSLVAMADSLSSTVDSLTSAMTGVSDSLSVPARPDSVVNTPDKRAIRQALRDEKKRRKEARWARLDSLDAAKAAAKQERKMDKARRKKLRILEDQDRQNRKDAARLEKYRRRYEKKYARKNKSTGIETEAGSENEAVGNSNPEQESGKD